MKKALLVFLLLALPFPAMALNSDLNKPVTGASISGIVGITNGGTGATTASGARTNLGLGDMSLQSSNNVTISGGQAQIYRPVDAQTTTNYTLVLGDAGKMVTLSNASAITMTVPTNASVAFPVGTEIDLAQLGAGQVTVAAAGGVTINSYGGLLKLAGQYAGGTLKKTASDTWLLVGLLSS